MSKDKLQISVTVAGRAYSLTVSPDEVAPLQKAESQLNKDFFDLQKSYKASKEDLLAMLLLTYAKKVQEVGADGGDAAVQDKLTDILLRLDNALKG